MISRNSSSGLTFQYGFLNEVFLGHFLQNFGHLLGFPPSDPVFLWDQNQCHDSRCWHSPKRFSKNNTRKHSQWADRRSHQWLRRRLIPGDIFLLTIFSTSSWIAREAHQPGESSETNGSRPLQRIWPFRNVDEPVFASAEQDSTTEAEGHN